MERAARTNPFCVDKVKSQAFHDFPMKSNILSQDSYRCTHTLYRNIKFAHKQISPVKGQVGLLSRSRDK